MKKKLLSTLLTLALLLLCGNAPAAEHVHQLRINPTCIPYNLVIPLDEEYNSSDFTAPVINSMVGVYCATCEKAPVLVQLPISEMNLTYNPAESTRATCESNGIYYFTGFTFDVAFDGGVYPATLYTSFNVPAPGHDWSNRDGVCARKACGKVCDHSLSASGARPTPTPSGAVAEPTVVPPGSSGNEKNTHFPACAQSAVCDICGKTLPALSHVYGEWEPDGEGTNSALCLRCGQKATTACPMLSFTLPAADESAKPVSFSLCPVCGAVSTGRRLEAAQDAQSAQALTGALIVRMGEAADGVRVMTVTAERAGQLLAPTGRITISLPAALAEGCSLSLLAADGSETALDCTTENGRISFTLSFTDANGQPVPAHVVRLIPEA